jgi:hypothetical protein
MKLQDFFVISEIGSIKCLEVVRTIELSSIQKMICD